ncbi:hypothetical protein JCM8547_008016 [Rhodosporidiobolus lusitaniae]
MAVLPPELLTEIGTYLFLDTRDRERAQTALCHLCRMSKVYRDIFTPLLFRNPVLRESEQVEDWAMVINSAVAATLKEGGSVAELQVQSVKPAKVFILLPGTENDPLPVLAEFYGRTASQAESLPDLYPALRSGAFRQLTTLKLVNVFISNQPPSHPSRPWHDLELKFLLEAMQYFDSETCTSFTFSPKAHRIYGDRFRDLNYAEQDDMVRQLIKEAHSDFSVFSGIWSTRYADWDGSCEDYVASAKPIDVSPWNHLTVLNLQIMSTEPLCLMFQSTAFPSLRKLTLHGRTSEFPLDNPGKILEPQLEWYDRPDADYDHGGWGAPTQQELDKYKHKPYRGPKLSFLDMRNLTIMLPW